MRGGNSAEGQVKDDFRRGEIAKWFFVVELSPECDHVQGKLSTTGIFWRFRTFRADWLLLDEVDPNNNVSVIDVGLMAFKKAPKDEFHLLISTRC